MPTSIAYCQKFCLSAFCLPESFSFFFVFSSSSSSSSSFNILEREETFVKNSEADLCLQWNVFCPETVVTDSVLNIT